jgi:hypothetical protein
MSDDPRSITVTITADIKGLMDGLNDATSGVKDATAKMAASFAPLTASSASSFDSMTGQSKQAAESMEGDFSRTEARHAAHMLGMNRAVGGFVATLPGVGQALSMAFAPLAIMEMIEWIAKGVEKLYDFSQANNKAAVEWGKLTETFSDMAITGNNSLDSLRAAFVGITQGPIAEMEYKLAHINQQFLGLESWNSISKDIEEGTKQISAGFGHAGENAKAFGETLKNALKSGGIDSGLQSVNTELGKAQTEQARLNQLAAHGGIGQGPLDSQAKYVQLLQETAAALQQDSDKEAEQEKIAKARLQAAIDQKGAAAGKAASERSQAASEARLKGIEQATAATMNAEDKAADEELKQQEGAIKQQIALAVQGGQDKAAAELAALPKYIAAQQAYTQAKLAALDKDHAAQLKANADETALLNAGNSGGQNNAKLIESANQRAAIEAKYQTERKSIVAAGRDAVVTLETQEINESTELARKGAAERKAAAVAEINDSLSHQKAAAATTVQQARDDAAAGIITKQQLLQAEHAYIAAVLSDEERALTIKQMLYADDLKEFNKLNDEKLADERKAQDQSAAIDKKAAADHLKTAETWISGLTSGMNSAVSGMIKGTESFGQAMKSVMSSMVDFVISQLMKMLVKHISVEVAKTTETAAQTAARKATETAAAAQTNALAIQTGAVHATVEGAKTGATLTGTALRVAAEIWASVTTMARKIAEGVAWIAVEGWKAMASAWASISAIPVVGPFLAPAVAAGVLASVIAIGANLSSAAGGWDQVPSDQVAQLHKNEMVLPASIAGPLRGAIAGGGFGGSGGSGDGDTHVHIHALKFDRQFWQSQQGEIVNLLSNAIKNRRRG